MDAVCTQDDRPVMLKRVFLEEGPHELSITRRFSSPGLAGDPRNYCVPLLDVIELEGTESHKLMVLPLLRPFHRPRFQTFGEFVAFFTQLCEVPEHLLPCIVLTMLSIRLQGLKFMHERNVAHRYEP
jgi:serine/threonine protein kinase